jgi:hypothetical protein
MDFEILDGSLEEERERGEGGGDWYLNPILTYLTLLSHHRITHHRHHHITTKPHQHQHHHHGTHTTHRHTPLTHTTEHHHHHHHPHLLPFSTRHVHTSLPSYHHRQKKNLKNAPSSFFCVPCLLSFRVIFPNDRDDYRPIWPCLVPRPTHVALLCPCIFSFTQEKEEALLFLFQAPPRQTPSPTSLRVLALLCVRSVPKGGVSLKRLLVSKPRLGR